ncbi:MAG: DNA-formamidopyrimidine glycosylase [Candidatus Izemoplasmatales bacterium]
MPELPEVETVRRTLENILVGKSIVKTVVFYDKMLVNKTKEEFDSLLRGKKILKIGRYGKYLIFYIGDMKLISHLRMEGKFFIKPETSEVEKHEHLLFYLDDHTTLRYHDTRKFGTMELLNEFEETTSGLLTIGLEPFEEGFTYEYLKKKIGKTNRAIKTVLLDQKNVAGLGNIYVDEVLFLSKIYPEKLASSLKPKEIKEIVKNAKIVLEHAVLLGGSTIRSYTSSLGVTGRFQNELYVHMRKDEPCKICGSMILKTRVGGRGTYYCPQCQRK